jgi:aspartyl protease family protein
MSEQPPSPWSPPPPKQRPPSLKAPPRRWGALLLILAAVAAGIWALSVYFPGTLSSGADWQNVAQGMMMVTIVASILLRLRLKPHEALRNILAWAVIAAVLALGYSFRGELGSAWSRVRAEFAPGYPVQLSAHEMVVTQDENGGFYVVGEVNGQTVRFLADTGASDIVLSPADAERLGVDVHSLKFTDTAETANGVGRGASFKASSLEVGPVRFEDVPMQINQAPMSTSLLGMAFFHRLDSFQVKDGKLYMRWTG